jgi:lipopolysaccharide transport system ATP-binding protein
MSTVIKVENLGKMYMIGHKRESYTALRDVLTNKARQLINNSKQFITGGNLISGNELEEFWALKDVSFEVNQGDRIGIIGRNGAGKSTLLKVLSRITEPTKGRIQLKGRVASLLEVGTGFHPELSGRENIFLNGAILGMSRAEIRKKFDEIVDFAGVEKFLDTPVKRYSSGMYVRLAFSVAAHLEPEILIIDEVLSVGDAEFQKKCLGKMEDVSTKEGRTVIFVSHNMGAVTSLCNKCLMLEKGRINLTGLTSDVIHNYLHSAEQLRSTWKNRNNEYPNAYFTPVSISIVDSGLNEKSIFPNNEHIGILIEGKINNIDPSLAIGIAVYSSDDQLLFWALHTDKKKSEWVELHLGLIRFLTWIPMHHLNEGDYRVELNVSLHYKEWILQPGKNSPSIQFSIQGCLSESPHWQDKRPGLLAPILDYKILS